MNLITTFIFAFYTYLVVGIVFAIWFVIRGAQKIDTGMHGVHWSLRLLLLPGSMALWPVLLSKLIKMKNNGS